MSNLFDLEEDEDEIFKPIPKGKPKRNLDDLLDTGTKSTSNSNTLDDILPSKDNDEDLFGSSTKVKSTNQAVADLDDLLTSQPSDAGTVAAKSKKKIKKKPPISLFEDDVDDEPDIFNFAAATKTLGTKVTHSKPTDDANKDENLFSEKSETKKEKVNLFADDDELESSNFENDVDVVGAKLEAKVSDNKKGKDDIKLDVPNKLTESFTVSDNNFGNKPKVTMKETEDSLDSLLGAISDNVALNNDDLTSLVDGNDASTIGVEMRAKKTKVLGRKPSFRKRKSKNVTSDIKKDTTTSLDDILDVQPNNTTADDGGVHDDKNLSLSTDKPDVSEPQGSHSLSSSEQNVDKPESDNTQVNSDWKQTTQDSKQGLSGKPEANDSITSSVYDKLGESEENSLKEIHSDPADNIISTNDAHTKSTNSKKTSVTKPLIKSCPSTIDQSGESLDNLLDTISDNQVNDDLSSLIDNNDTLNINSDKKEKRKSIKRKPSKLGKKPKIVNKKVNIDDNKKPSSLDDLLDTQPTETEPVSDVLPKSGNIAEFENDFSAESSQTKDATQQIDKADEAQDVPVKAQDVPVEAQDVPVEAQDVPVEAQDVPVEAQDVPVEAQDVPVEAQDVPVEAQDVPVEAQDVPVEAKPENINDNTMSLSRETCLTVENDSLKSNETTNVTPSTESSPSFNDKPSDIQVPLESNKTTDQSGDSLDNLLDTIPDNEATNVTPSTESSPSSNDKPSGIQVPLESNKATDQSGDSLDNLLNTIPDNEVTDDLSSLIDNNDTSNINSDKKEKRKSIKRKPSKLGKKPKIVNKKNDLDVNKESSSLDDLLDIQPTEIESIFDDLSKTIQKSDKIENDTDKESSEINVAHQELEEADQTQYVQADIKQENTNDMIKSISDATSLTAKNTSLKSNEATMVTPSIGPSPSSNDNPSGIQVLLEDKKTTGQSGDSLDNLLDTIQDVAINDDLSSLIEKNDTLNINSDKKEKRKSIKRKPSKLGKKPKIVNEKNDLDVNEESSTLDDLLDTQPTEIEPVSDDVSESGNMVVDVENDISTEFSEAKISSRQLNDTVQTEEDQVNNKPENTDIDNRSFLQESSLAAENTSLKSDEKPVVKPSTKPCPTSIDQSSSDPVPAEHIKTMDQSGDSLDNLLNTIPDNQVNDDLSSLINDNDTLIINSDKKEKRKSIKRKPSKLGKKPKIVNKKNDLDVNEEPDSLDALLDTQPTETEPVSDDVSKSGNTVVDVENDISTESLDTNAANNQHEETDQTQDVQTDIIPETADNRKMAMLDETSLTAKITSLKSDETTFVKPDPSLNDQTNGIQVTQVDDITTDQSGDSLDNLLDTIPDVPVNDDLSSLIDNNDTSNIDSNKKEKRKSIKRKPSKLGKKTKIVNKKIDLDDNEESSSLDDLLDMQITETELIADDIRKVVDKNNAEGHEEGSKLEDTLNDQSLGMVTSMDAPNVADPITNKADSTNSNEVTDLQSQASPTKDTDLVDDLFGELNEEESVDINDLVEDSTVEKSIDDNIVETDKDKPDTVEDEDSEPEIDSTPKPKTNLKKTTMERSFEDLLNGLSDDSDPELEDIVPDDIDNTNLEKKGGNSNNKSQSLLGSPDKSYLNIKTDTSQFTSKHFDTTHDMDVVSSTPKITRNAESPKVKVTPPEVKVQTPEDEEVDYDISGDNNFAKIDDDDDDNDVEMVTRPTRKSTLSSDDDVDLGVIEDTNHLDVDVSKHKSALGKKGSLALRRKQSRRSRKSLLSTGEDAIFQDSSDAKPEMMNGDDDDDDTFGNKDDDDGYDLSPPAKKHSPATMMPLPGMATKPPTQISSVSRHDDNDEEMNKEIKRKSKPPPGAFVLPAMGASPIKPRRPNSESSEKTAPDSKPNVFEKPALRSVKPKERSRSPVEETTPTFGRNVLKNTEKSDLDMKSTNEERDVTFQKPSLRSTPKPTRDKTPEKKMDTNAGTFEKPALRNTPKPKLEQKPTEPVEQEDTFMSRNLRSVQKQDNSSIDHNSDIHKFDKPTLKSSKPRADNTDDLFKNDSKLDTKTFEKPSLRSTNKNLHSDSIDKQGYEPSHSFEKPALRTGTPRTSAVKKQDSITTGIFEKPSLKKTTPSPEKEVKELNEPKGTFDRPQLRKTDSLKEREEKERHSEKPSWLQKASDKQGRALDILQAKENQSSSDKQLPSWLEKSPLRKTKGIPLQDTSNNQSTNSSQSDLSTEDYGKSTSSTPRSRNSSQGTENEPERRSSITEKIDEDNSDIDELFDDLDDYNSDEQFDGDDDESPKDHNNYTPGWMRQTRSPSVPSTGGVSPAKSLPALNESNEVPQWKKELAQRRQNRKERITEEVSKKEETKEPEWKKGIQLRKTRNTNQPSKETHSVEPEWKKAAEEKRQRLRNTVVDN